MKMNTVDPVDSVKLMKSRKLNVADRTPRVKLPPIRGKKSNETCWEIKALPCNWVPNKTPSKASEKMFEIRQEAHERCLIKFRNKIKYVNMDIEDKLLGHSTSIKLIIQHCEENILEALGKINFGKYVELVENVKKATFDKVEETINGEIHGCVCHINEFYATLQKTEKERSKQLKILLKTSYEEIDEINFFLPLELQTFFEEEIMKINQITLSNYRYYDELRLKLISKTENERRLWLQECQDLTETYIFKRKECLKQKYKNRGNLSVSIDVFAAQIWGDVNSVYDRGRIISFEYINILSTQITDKLGDYQNVMFNLKGTIEGVIEKIFVGKFDQVQNIAIENYEKVLPAAEWTSLFNDVLNSFYENPIQKRIDVFTINMMDEWEELLYQIQAELDTSTKTLESTIHIWDAHFQRIFETKELFQIDLKNLMEKHVATEDSEHNKMNILIDQVRQSSDEDELKSTMGTIKKCLENIMKVIQNNHQAEKKYFDKYRNFAETEWLILVMEMKAYLKLYANCDDIDPTLQRGRASKLDLVVIKKPPVIMQIFKNHIKSLHNWTYGLKETVSVAAEHCGTDSMDDCNQWIDSQYLLLDRRVLTKIEIYKPRFERIYYDIYNVRLAELKQHAQRLESHKLGITLEIDRLRELIRTSVPRFDYIQTNFNNEILKFDDRIKRVKSSAIVKLYINQVQHLKRVNLEKMLQTRNEYLDTYEQKINEIKASTLNYIKFIKLFNECGNYSGEELKWYKTELSKVQKNLNKVSFPVLKSIEVEYEKYNALIKKSADSILEILSEIQVVLEFQERMTFEGKSVQNAIKTETYSLRLSYKTIEKCFERLRTLAGRHVGELLYLKEFFENCAYAEDAFRDTRELLHQKKLLKLNEQVFRSRAAETGGGDLDVYYIKSNLVEITTPGNVMYNSILFAALPTDNTDYMSRIVNILFKSLTLVQDNAKEFYAKQIRYAWPVIKFETIQDFMVDTLAKYLYYQLQCEEVWLEVCIDYMVLIDAVLEFIRGYYIESIEQYLILELEKFKKICSEYTALMKKNARISEISYAAHHSKLKPLHGHPNNSDLLEDLIKEKTELDETTENLQSQSDELYIIAKDTILENMNQFREDLYTLDVELKKIINHYVMNIVEDENLTKQIDDRIAYLMDIIESDVIIKDSNMLTNIVIELNRKLRQFKTGLCMTRENLVRYSQVISKLVLYGGGDSETTVSSRNSNMDLDDLVQMYGDKQQACVENLIVVQDLTLVSKKWSELWENDVKKIKEFYQVNYTGKQAAIFKEIHGYDGSEENKKDKKDNKEKKGKKEKKSKK